MYDITLWNICVTIVAMELQRCVPFFVVVIHVSVNNIKMFIIAMEMQQVISFALLST